jgi:ribosome-associated protein
LRTCIHCANEDHGSAFSHIGDNVDTLHVSDGIRIPMSEIHMTAIRSQGAGGQNVNKVATAIHLRFDVQNSSSIPERVKQKFQQMSDHRITDDGVIVIKSQAHRSQDRNRQAALSRLEELLVSALREPKRRIKTKLSKNVKKRRLDSKTRRGALKKTRRTVDDD